MDSVRLNLGSGRTPIPGWTNVDIKAGGSAYPLTQYADGSVDEIRASHILEHFSHHEVALVLREWVRVLKRGGKLYVAVPDFERISRAYLDGEKLPIQQYVTGGQVDEHDYHKAVFDRELLTEAMEYVGLTDLGPWEGDNGDCSTLPISLNLVGTKEADPNCPSAKMETRDMIGKRVAAVMSMPRLAFTDNLFCAFESLVPLGIRLVRSSGVFWGQCLTEMIEDAIRDGFDYVLTVDYDTVFTGADVRRLYHLMNAHDGADAICAMQQKRSSDHVLFTIQNAEGKALTELDPEALDADLLEVHTAHFGLTLFRCAAFADIEKPWFIGKPDEDGRWGKPHIVDGRIEGGKMDDDIHFWSKFHDAGKRLYQANKVVVGHVQLVVTWPGPDLSPVHQHIYEYNRKGKPLEGVR
jgi:predicted SAM-dependent methyltransferase